MGLFSNKTVYLIDSENVNDNWIDAISDMAKSDEIRVYCTEKSQNLSPLNLSKISEAGVKLEWVKCFTGNNALDFQLVSELGYLIAKNPRDNFVIVSNDRGYEPVINYWLVKENAKIKRLTVENSKPATKPNVSDTKRSRTSNKTSVKPRSNQSQTKIKSTKPEVEKNKSQKTPTKSQETKKKAKNVAKESPVKKQEPSKQKTASKQKTEDEQKQQRFKAPKSDNDYINAISRSLAMSELNDVHSTLVHLFGADKGSELYNDLRKDSTRKETLAKNLLKDKNSRQENYIKIFLSKNNHNVSDCKKILSVIKKTPSDDLNVLYQNFTKNFDEEKGRDYYNILKGTAKIITRL